MKGIACPPKPASDDSLFHHVTTSTGLQFQFQPLVDYIRNQWIAGVTPESLSLHRLDTRTNNAVESNNAYLLREAGARAPIWKLVCKFLSSLASDRRFLTLSLADQKSSSPGTRVSLSPSLLPSSLTHGRSNITLEG